MGPEPDRQEHSEYLAKIILTGVFLGGIALFASWRLSTGQGLDAFHMTVGDLVLLVFATLRVGRMLAYDLIMEPLRSPFTVTVPDGTGAGDSVEPKGRGLQRALGQLISCPICAGTWSAGLLVLGMYAFPGPVRILITILGAIGAAEVLNSLIEGSSWSGQLARAKTGVINRAQAGEAQPSAPAERRAPVREDDEEDERVGAREET
jgi:hypothetical protein